MPYQIELRQIAPQLLAVVRDVATSDTLVQKILGSPVWTYLGAHGIKSGGHNIVVYFDEGRPEFRVEIGADVFAPFAGSDGVVCSATPGGRVATTRHISGPIPGWRKPIRPSAPGAGRPGTASRGSAG
jgi:hypothetical protein